MNDDEIGQIYQFPDAIRISRILSPRTPKKGMKGAELKVLDNYDCVVDTPEFQAAFTAAKVSLEASKRNSWQPRPVEPAPEQTHYESLAEFLNACVYYGGDALDKSRGSWYDELNFVVYARVMGDTVENAFPVKPCLLGGNTLVASNGSTAKDTLFWSPPSDQDGIRAEIPVERNPSRTFALVIGYNETGGLRFLVFHRGGLTSHVPLLLNTPEGRADALRLVMTLLLWSNPRDAGLVSTSNELEFWIPRPSDPQSPNCIKATTKQILHTSNCVRGRATRVSRLSCRDPDASGVSLAVAVSQASVFRRRSSRPAANSVPSPPTSAPRSRKAADVRPSTEVEEPSTIPVEPRGKHPKHRMEWSLPAGLTNGSPPNMQDVEGRDVVLKASWQTESVKDAEKSMYMAGAGAFGTAVVLYSYEATHPTGEPVSNCLLVPTRQEMTDNPNHPWTIGKSENETPEIRDLCITVFLSIGHLFYEAKSSYDICIGIAHALLGWLSYYQSGWMHRDISIGNVLLTLAQIGKDINALIEKLEIGSKCTAFVTDGDLAIQWTTYFDDQYNHAIKFGTPEFMSLKLQRAMNKNTAYIQSPADDVQSFFWVMLWAVLFNNMDQKRSQDELDWRAEMEGADVRAKSGFVTVLNSEEFDPEFSSVEYSAVGAQLFPLLQVWWGKQMKLEADWGNVLREAKRISPESQARFNLHHYHLFALRGVKEFLEIVDKYAAALKSYGQFPPPSSSL
ncbi:hypothetical protein B0H16DRAFT_1857212 [Mycena metata]|uniref:Fungal-type protein kinase domain-containing protein n=1 Tax=Mycena metata TaxID=1033252 RepID=A0AAD7GDZ9_9AGAR|nr:hypothetical protein B0H16DRAFT_1857212 [Mycena metata]